MMFGREDFKIHDAEDFAEFSLIFIFIALVAPLIIAAYTLGFVLDKTGWLDTSS
jgi:hypothetical protein